MERATTIIALAASATVAVALARRILSGNVEAKPPSSDCSRQPRVAQLPPSPPPLLARTNNLSGHNIIVTGASRSGTLGGEVARYLAASGASALVLVGSSPRCDTPASAHLEHLEDELRREYPGCRVFYLPCQLGDAGACCKLVEEACSLFSEGKLHGLVNCAGVCFPRATLDETTPETFQRMMSINVLAPLLLTRDAARAMRKERIQGSIVNIGSIAAHGGAPFISAYSVSKGALNTLTKVSAVELQPNRIRVNCVNIGWTVTENEDKERRRSDGEDWVEKAEATQRSGRLLRPGDIAPTVGHLLSRASAMVTGTCLDISPEVVFGCLPVGAG